MARRPPVMKQAQEASILLASFLLAAAPAMAQPEPAPIGASWPQVSAGHEYFYDGPVTWLWPYGEIFGDNVMTGYGTTVNGGTVTSATACLWNDSVFSRVFKVDVKVDSASPRRKITFSRSFDPQVVTCHRLTKFHTYVAPGELSISVTYRYLDADNRFLRFPATSSGSTFDVEIDGERPPLAYGPQGSIKNRGVGISYEIDRDTTPPPPPPTPPPAMICHASKENLCFLREGQFLVSAGRTGDSGYLDGIVVDGNEGSAQFWFLVEPKWELMVNIQPRTGRPYVFSAAGLSPGRSYDVRVEHVETGKIWDFALDSGRRVTNFPLE